MLGNLFDPKMELGGYEHDRPHWTQAGAIVFITFRTADSIPQSVAQQWERERVEWLQRNGIVTQTPWQQLLPSLPPNLRDRFIKRFARCREAFLDSCYGDCVLRDKALAAIVSDALLHFDGQRYRMGDFIVMPNHVHLMASFPDEDALKAQCASWLHYSAWKINRRLGRRGKLWQQEPFDHLVRNANQYQYLRNYIANNGKQAHLPSSDYLYRQYKDQNDTA